MIDDLRLAVLENLDSIPVENYKPLNSSTAVVDEIGRPPSL